MINNNPAPRVIVEKERYGSLDGLRAYAMICIIIMHVRAFLPYHHAKIIGSFSHFVLLFMMVSAFSMCCGYYQRIKEGSISPSQFYKRRYVRILPYFAFLCFLELLIHPNRNNLYEFVANITLCFGFLPNPKMEMMGGGWFLGLIFIFYLMFPFYVFLIDNKRRSWLSLGCTVIFAFIAIAYFYNPPFVEKSPRMHNIIYCMPYFVMGGIIFLERERIVGYCKTHIPIMTFLTVLITVLFFIFRPNISNTYAIYVLELIMFSIWIMYALFSKDVFLNNKLTRILSTISLEMYLAQMVAFRGVQFLHLEKYVSNETWLYALTSFLTLIVVILFTYITKTFIVDKIVSRLKLQ